MKKRTDFLVIGSGIAGLTFALRAAKSGKVSIVTKGKLEDSKDFVEWAGDYQHYIELKQELEEKLKVVA